MLTIEQLHAEAKAIRDANPEPCTICEGSGKDEGDDCIFCKGKGSKEPFYPIVITSMKSNPKDIFHPKLLFGGVCGDFVRIRPCLPDNDPNDGKTFLGVIIGELTTGIGLRRDNKEPGVIELAPMMHNPMIFVPELKRVVFGYESWWGRINNADDLRKITDADINNVWYVQALKALAERDAAAKNAETE